MQPNDSLEGHEKPLNVSNSPNEQDALGLPTDVVAQLEEVQDDIKEQLIILLSYFMSDGHDLRYAADHTASFLTQHGEIITAEQVIALAELSDEVNRQKTPTANVTTVTSSPEQKQPTIVNLSRADFFSTKPIDKKQLGIVGRNEPCPCGSGKKFKKCCGQN